MGFAWTTITRASLIAFKQSVLPTIFRITTAVFGGYLLVAGVSALAARALVAWVLPPSEAVVLMGILGFLLYLVALLWAFTERRLSRVLVVLGVFGPLAFGLAELFTLPWGEL